MTAGAVDVLVNLGSLLGEGPVWDHREGVLAWVDILGHTVHRTDPDDGTTTIVPVGTSVGALALLEDDGYLLAVQAGFGRLADGDVEPIAHVVDRPGMRMNDGALDPAGRFVAGTITDDPSAGPGALFVLDLDGEPRVLLDDVHVSNGLAWTDSGTEMYYVDSATQGIDLIAYDPGSGSVGNRRRWVDVPAADGIPDGITVDAEGCVWVALWGGSRVRRYAPDGSVVGEIEFPVPQITSCAFGGPGLDRLFVTSASVGRPGGEGGVDGALFVTEPGAVGRPEPVARVHR